MECGGDFIIRMRANVVRGDDCIDAGNSGGLRMKCGFLCGKSIGNQVKGEIYRNATFRACQ